MSGIAIVILGIPIYWYGIFYFFSFLISYIILIYTNLINEKEKDLENLFVIVLLSSIIGARIFHIVFYDLIYYLENPIKIFFLREGGLSIHGGIFFGVISTFFFCKKKKMNFLKIIDFFSVIGLFFFSIGRIANHINKELVGIKTDFFLGFNYGDGLRHPVVLYESLFYFILFQIILYYYFKKKFETGKIFLICGIFYSFIRFFLEFLKETKIAFYIFSYEQVLTFLTFLTFLIFYLNFKKLSKLITSLEDK